MPTSPVIEIRNLARRVPNREKPLVQVAEMVIHGADRIGISGASGSGKSTLLRAIAMLDPCESCELSYRGQAMTPEQVPTYRRKVVYLPQRSPLVASTVRDNLQLPFRINIAASEYREQDAVGELSLLGKPHDFLDQPAQELSGGERQLVALLRAVLVAPEVLLLDEPTASLDPDSARIYEQAVMRWCTDSEASSRSFLLVSHNPAQVARMTNRTLKMSAGHLIDGDLHA